MSSRTVVVGNRKVIISGFPDKPDWNFWRAMPTAELWQAVALACNADPSGEMEKAYGDRLEIAKAHAMERGFPLAESSLEMGKPELWRVRLAEFATWADGVGWDLPAEFPRPKADQTKSESVPEKPMTTTERNTLLTIIAALCKYDGLDPQERGAAQRIMEMTDDLGAHVDDETIRKHLAKIPVALETRMK
jgi:hypothetical protein